MATSTAICKARLLSDLSGQTACDKPATSYDGRLCAFHSRQCQALYRGYKRRNAQLDTLIASPPPFLQETKTSLVNQDFTSIETEPQLRELHSYLFKKYNLLDRVIRARRLHHSHFFAVDMDYGHEKYLTKLQNDRHIVARALEKLGRRAAQIMYKEQQWLSWVQKCQIDEEKKRENESKKVKLEAMLFKRHQKEMEKHHRIIQQKEQKKQEEAFLDEVYQKRLAEMSEEEKDGWDPVQDVFEDERDNYLDLIRFFLMVKDQVIVEPKEGSEGSETPATPKKPSEAQEPAKPLSKSAKKRAKKVNAELENKSARPEGRGPDTIEMETKSQMRHRLRQSVKFQRTTGWYFAGSEGPSSLDATTKPIPDDEIDVLLEEVAEIKRLLFCRLLLSHASLLPIALQANSIEEFLENEQVTQENLRDLCLKLERPHLQDVRDACADFVRGETEEQEDEETPQDDEEEENEEEKKDDKYAFTYRPGAIPDKFQTRREARALKKRNNQKDADVNSAQGETNKSQQKRMRIKVCGKYMYNFRSEKSLGRGGWYHFAVIAKDSDLYDAIELCRNWNEFYELNILCVHHYFPAAKWTIWVGDLLRQQLLTLGFIPYFISDKASKLTHYFQSGSRGMSRRAHQVLEVRNFVCGHVKRDDPATCRFIQYLSMETFDLIALVRDPKTGRTLIKPDDEELWIVREKSGWGRAAKNEYQILETVGPSFFERMDNLRKWHFGFNEYYDVYIWDPTPGRPYLSLQKRLEETLMRALRVKDHKDCFMLAKPILETLTKDPTTDRVRSIRPGEKVEAIWDSIKPGKTFSWTPATGAVEDTDREMFKYTEADALEDEWLFPEEKLGTLKNNLFKKKMNPIEKLMSKPPVNLRKFVNDLDTDDTGTTSTEGDDKADADEKIIVSGGDSSDWESTDSEDVISDEDESYAGGSNVPEEDVHAAIDILSEKFKLMTTSQFMKPDFFVGILKNRFSALASQLPESVMNNDAELMGTLRYALMSQKQYNDTEGDFYRHIDREKSKVFKDAWHMADFEPGHQLRWFQMQTMVNNMDSFLMNKITPGAFEMMAKLDLIELVQEERRIVTDAFEAYAAMSLFFEADAFLESEFGLLWTKEHLLLNQAERAKPLHLPDRRSNRSNKTMPKEFWSEWDELLKKHKRGINYPVEDIFPVEWAKVSRPIIIQLYKAGIIRPSYVPESAGIATALCEPSRPRDLYFDFRERINELRAKDNHEDPASYDRNYFVDKAREFAQTHSNARFAALRLWSAPHFYPLMFGNHNRPVCAFLDDRNRCWEWLFIPKDMPYSELSIHQQVWLRIQPWRQVFGSQVIVARDMVLVMGKDEDDLRMMASAATFALQTKPWRLEVDLWRSFVNIDFKFLEELDARWLE